MLVGIYYYRSNTFGKLTNAKMGNLEVYLLLLFINVSDNINHSDEEVKHNVANIFKEKPNIVFLIFYFFPLYKCLFVVIWRVSAFF